MMLQEVLQSALDRHLLTPARVGPMRTAVKQFSAMFGVLPEQLTPEQYHLPKDALFRFIEQHSAQDVGPSKLRNTKNNIHWLLDLAVREGWLRPMAGTSRTWRTRHLTGRRSPRRARTDGSYDTSHALYALLRPFPELINGRPSRLRSYKIEQRQGLQLAPQAFLDEIEAYLNWCQKAHAPGRDAKVRKRASTADAHRSRVLRIGGYAHHMAGIPLDEITLERLTQPALVEQFVGWWVNERRGRVTLTIQNSIRTLTTIARHWLKDQPRAEALTAIDKSLSNDQGPVWDKEQSLVPLRTIEEVGLKTYPFTAERMQRSSHLRTMYKHMRDSHHAPMPNALAASYPGHKIGVQVMMSLIIRLLVRLPMRQRCIREMRLDHNLKKLPDGNWEIHFKGIELKIASRKQTGLNEYRHPIAPELTRLINEWLTFWRPRRLPAEGSDLVFLNENGRQLTDPSLNRLFIRAIYRITGIRTTIHMVRDSWASDYLDSTGDVAGCADKLGDTVEMVLKHYAHVLKRRAQGRTDSWLQDHLRSAG